MSSIILGIDPGFALLGFSFLENKDRNRQKVLTYGVIETKASTPIEQRLLHISTELEMLIKKYNPELMAIENLYFGKNAKTAIDVGQARGVILLQAAQAQLPIIEFTPLQIKMALTGYGRADKHQVQIMVKQLLGLKSIPKPDDAADAIAVALTAAVSNPNHFKN